MATDNQNRRSGPARGLRRISNRIESLGDEQFVYLLLAPTFLILLIFAFWPVLRTLQISFHANNIWGASDVGAFVGLSNYVELFDPNNPYLTNPFFDLNHPFESSVTVTAIFTVIGVSIEAVLGVLWAVVLDRSFRGRRWVRLIVLLPWGVPIAIHGMIFYLLFSPGVSFLVEPLANLGLISAAPLSVASNALFLAIIADIWKTTPFIALIVLASMQSIDRDLYDVAKVNGATRWQQFRMITYPLILPALLVAILFRIIQALKVYGIIEIMSGCNTVPTLSCAVVSTFQTRYYGTSAAVAFVTAILVGAVVSVYLARFREDVL